MELKSLTSIGNYRNCNDDSCYFDEEKGFLLIADGMGGYSGGNIASDVAVSIFKNHYLGVSEETYRDDLKDLFSMVNSEIIEKAASDYDYQKMGTTLSVFCFHNDKYYIGHIGDSRIYLFRNDQLSLLTEDHNMASEMLRSGKISRKDAEHHPGKHLLTRVLGRKPLPEIYFNSGELLPDDIVLLCTDGISGVLTDKKISNLLKKFREPDAILEELTKKALKSGAMDNLSAMIFKNN